MFLLGGLGGGVGRASAKPSPTEPPPPDRRGTGWPHQKVEPQTVDPFRRQKIRPTLSRCWPDIVDGEASGAPQTFHPIFGRISRTLGAAHTSGPQAWCWKLEGIQPLHLCINAWFFVPINSPRSWGLGRPRSPGNPLENVLRPMPPTPPSQPHPAAFWNGHPGSPGATQSSAPEQKHNSTMSGWPPTDTYSKPNRNAWVCWLPAPCLRTRRRSWFLTRVLFPTADRRFSGSDGPPLPRVGWPWRYYRGVRGTSSLRRRYIATANNTNHRGESTNPPGEAAFWLICFPYLFLGTLAGPALCRRHRRRRGGPGRMAVDLEGPRH